MLVGLLLMLWLGDSFRPFGRGGGVRRASSSPLLLLLAEQQAAGLDDGTTNMFRKYDGDLIDSYYRSRPLEVWERAIEIGSPLLGWWILRKWDNVTRFSRDDRENKLRASLRAADLRDAIVQGGSITFIKSGQALSLRPDLVKSADYVRELSKLQDEVGTFPNDVAFGIMREELGRDPDEVYEFNPPEPIASASIGQVYRAVVRATNETVAVKVQRPDALQTAPVDMFILRSVAAIIKKRKNIRSNLVAIADEFGRQLWQELNYTQEARNCARFKELYGEIDGIYVPSVDFGLTTRRVLTMEFVNGVKGPWLRGGERMLTVGLQCSVLQLLGKGYFHSDPHRGNLLMTENGELAYLDFGMMCEVPADRRFALIGTVLGLVNKDIPLVINSLKTLELLPDNTDTFSVVSALDTAVMNATQDGSSGSTLNFTQLNRNLESISSTGLLPFSLPPFYTLIIRTLTILEGLALSVDPSFRLVRGAYPFVAALLLNNPSREIQGLLQSVMLTPAGRIRWEKLEQFISISSNADAAMGGDFSALKAAQSRSDLINTYAGNTDRVDLSLDVALQILSFLLSDSGRFLREPLLDEVVETIDALGLTAASLAAYLSNGLLPRPQTKPNRETIERFLGLLRKLADASAARAAAQGGGPGLGAMGAMGRIAGMLLTALTASRDSEERRKLQPVLDKAGQIVSLLLGRLAERNVARIVRNVASPERVAIFFPFLARFLDVAAPRGRK